MNKSYLDICPVCLQPNENFIFIQDYSNLYGRFELLECKICQAQFWLPFKNPGHNWYEQHQSYISWWQAAPRLELGWHLKFLELHPTFSSGTVILDLGCGAGEFISECSRRGAEVWGVDFHEGAIAQAKTYFQLQNVFAASLNDFLSRSGLPKFDYVTLFEVIEHVDNPLSLMKAISKVLKPAGRVVITTPSRDRIFPNMSSWDFPYNHLTRWNQSSISYLGNLAGLKVCRFAYSNQFRWIFDPIVSKFRFNLLGKLKDKSDKVDRDSIVVGRTEEVHESKPKLLKRITLLTLRTIGWIKDAIFAGIPAIIIYLVSQVVGFRNGDMLTEFKTKT